MTHLQQVEQMCRRQKLELDNRAAKFGELDQLMIGLKRKFEESREENLQLTQILRSTRSVFPHCCRSVFWKTWNMQDPLITVRKRSCGKVMFYTCLSVILFTGGVCLSACWDTHPQADTPLGRHPLPSACWDRPPLAHCMLGYIPSLHSTSWDRHGYCCGR